MALALTCACGGSGGTAFPDASAATDAVDATPEATADVTLDAAPDTAPDVALEAGPDALPADRGPDAQADAAPDLPADTPGDAPGDAAGDAAPEAPCARGCTVTLTDAPPSAPSMTGGAACAVTAAPTLARCPPGTVLKHIGMGYPATSTCSLTSGLRLTCAVARWQAAAGGELSLQDMPGGRVVDAIDASCNPGAMTAMFAGCWETGAFVSSLAVQSFADGGGVNAAHNTVTCAPVTLGPGGSATYGAASPGRRDPPAPFGVCGPEGVASTLTCAPGSVAVGVALTRGAGAEACRACAVQLLCATPSVGP